jgi:hypothetical protein
MNHTLESSFPLKVELAETNTVFSRLTAWSGLEGNPQQVYIENFGNAKAFIVKGIPDPYFNSVRGLTSEDMDQLDNIIEFYHDHKVSCRFDIPPSVNPDLLLKLAERGYYQSGFHSSLYRFTNKELSIPGSDDGIEVRQIEDSEFNYFGEIYTKAFTMPDFLASAVTANNLVLKDRPGWQFYLATDNHVPAAVAVLYVQDGMASLAAAATLPAFQGRGYHSALLAARINEARKLECDLVVGQARFGSASEGNMKRFGLQLAYTKSIWKEMPK